MITSCKNEKKTYILPIIHVFFPSILFVKTIRCNDNYNVYFFTQLVKGKIEFQVVQSLDLTKRGGSLRKRDEVDGKGLGRGNLMKRDTIVEKVMSNGALHKRNEIVGYVPVSNALNKRNKIVEHLPYGGTLEKRCHTVNII